jgi:hypothetical protein
LDKYNGYSPSASFVDLLDARPLQYTKTKGLERKRRKEKKQSRQYPRYKKRTDKERKIFLDK